MIIINKPGTDRPEVICLLLFFFQRLNVTKKYEYNEYILVGYFKTTPALGGHNIFRSYFFSIIKMFRKSNSHPVYMLHENRCFSDTLR